MIEGTAPLAVFAVADAIRDESREAVQRLLEEQVILMTGIDHDTEWEFFTDSSGNL
jgi:hypothetical protein